VPGNTHKVIIFITHTYLSVLQSVRKNTGKAEYRTQAEVTDYDVVYSHRSELDAIPSVGTVLIFIAVMQDNDSPPSCPAMILFCFDFSCF
jgi:hypothetical protein